MAAKLTAFPMHVRRPYFWARNVSMRWERSVSLRNGEDSRRPVRSSGMPGHGHAYAVNLLQRYARLFKQPRKMAVDLFQNAVVVELVERETDLRLFPAAHIAHHHPQARSAQVDGYDVTPFRIVAEEDGLSPRAHILTGVALDHADQVVCQQAFHIRAISESIPDFG